MTWTVVQESFGLGIFTDRSTNRLEIHAGVKLHLLDGGPVPTRFWQASARDKNVLIAGARRLTMQSSERHEHTATIMSLIACPRTWQKPLGFKPVTQTVKGDRTA